jgi:hypothetical protein
MPVNAEDIKEALDRLSKALEAQAQRKEKDRQEKDQKAQERKQEQEQRRRERDQQARDNKLARLAEKEDEPTFDPNTTLGKLESAYGKYKKFREEYREAKSGDHPFKTLGKLFGRGGGEAGAGEGGEAAGGAAEGASGAAGGAAGAAGIVVAAFVAVYEYGKALIKFRNWVDKTTDALVAFNREFAEASPSMAAVMARRDVQELFRDRRKGEALAESAEYLTGAEQRRKDSEAPLVVLFTDWKNRALGIGNDVVAGMAKQLNALLGLSEDFEKGKEVGLAAELEKVAAANRQRLADERARLDRIKQQPNGARRF